MSSDNTFQQDWGFPSEVKATIPGATYHGTEAVPGTYTSGRPKFETTFLSCDRKVVARRPAMELISKKTGKPYFVCRRAEDGWNAARNPRPRGGSSESADAWCGGPPTAAARPAYTLDDAIA